LIADGKRDGWMNWFCEQRRQQKDAKKGLDVHVL